MFIILCYWIDDWTFNYVFAKQYGMSSALETLCGQAYGAQQYQNLGIHTYSATLSLTLVCIPISFMWLYMGKFLILIGQDPSISHEAGRFSTWLIPALFAYVILQILVRFLQAQSLILPLLVSSIASLVFFIPSCWVLVFKFGLGHVGAALAIGMSYWLNVILLGLYVMFSSACVRIRIPNSMELFRGTREFFCLAIPSAVMIWSWTNCTFFPFFRIFSISCLVFSDFWVLLLQPWMVVIWVAYIAFWVLTKS